MCAQCQNERWEAPAPIITLDHAREMMRGAFMYDDVRADYDGLPDEDVVDFLAMAAVALRLEGGCPQTVDVTAVYFCFARRKIVFDIYVFPSFDGSTIVTCTENDECQIFDFTLASLPPVSARASHLRDIPALEALLAHR